MKFKKIIVLVLTLVLVLGLVTGCGGGEATTENQGNNDGENQEQPKEKIVIRWGHFAPPEQPLEKALQNMAQRISDRTDGQVEIKSFPASQLGSIAEQLEQLQEGSLQMMYANASYISQLQPEFAVFDAPFVFDDIDHAREFSRSDMVQDMAKTLLNERDIRILDASPIFGPRHLSTKDTLVTKPEDLEGLKIRVHEAETRVDMIKAWGASPVVTPTAEMYLSMQTGLAQGQESPLSWQADNKYWEVQKYVMLTNHFIQNEMAITNDEFYQSLPDDIKQILREETIKLADEVTEMYIEANEAAKSTLTENGMEIIEDIDRDAFRKATQSMWNKWQDVWGQGAHERVVNRDYEKLTPEEWQNY